MSIGRGFAQALALIPLVAGTVGCSTIHTRTADGKAVTMDEQRFADYVEQVFRHHNAVVNDLLFTAANEEDGSTPLGQAEARMAYSCLPLNEVVSASAVGQSTSFWARKTLPKAVPECEAATRAVEALMKPAK